MGRYAKVSSSSSIGYRQMTMLFYVRFEHMWVLGSLGVVESSPMDPEWWKMTMLIQVRYNWEQAVGLTGEDWFQEIFRRENMQVFVAD